MHVRDGPKLCKIESSNRVVNQEPRGLMSQPIKKMFSASFSTLRLTNHSGVDAWRVHPTRIFVGNAGDNLLGKLVGFWCLIIEAQYRDEPLLTWQPCGLYLNEYLCIEAEATIRDRALSICGVLCPLERSLRSIPHDSLDSPPVSCVLSMRHSYVPPCEVHMSKPLSMTCGLPELHC